MESQWDRLPEESVCKHSLVLSPSPGPPWTENRLLGSMGSGSQKALDTLRLPHLLPQAFTLAPWITHTHSQRKPLWSQSFATTALCSPMLILSQMSYYRLHKPTLLCCLGGNPGSETLKGSVLTRPVTDQTH